uniref:Uncharacterized protein n=1 Tax=viral metagenome TaxID=1070528 RepID=A0A2V0R997_9ZZZZ
MSSEEAEYKGPKPTPAKGQTVKDFETEELGKKKEDGSPFYEEFQTVAEIQAKPEYFKIIVEQPEFKSMIEMEGTSDAKALPDDSSSDIEKQPAVLEVSLEEVSMPEPAMEEPEAPPAKAESKSEFIPIKLGLNDPIGSLQLKVEGDMIILDKGPYGDLLNQSTNGRDSKAAYAYYTLLQNFARPNLTAPITSSETGRFKASTMSNYFMDEKVCGRSAPNHLYQAEQTEPKSIDFTSEVDRDGGPINAEDHRKRFASTPGYGTKESGLPSNQLQVVDLSLEPRYAFGAKDVYGTSHHVLTAPSRIRLLLRDLRCYNYWVLDWSRWTAVHSHMLNTEFLRYIKRQNGKELRDILTIDKHLATRYLRISDHCGYSEDFYHLYMPDEPDAISKHVLDASMMAARAHVGTIAPGMRSITTNSSRDAASAMTQLSAFGAGEGSQFMRELCAFLLGGRRHKLEVELDTSGALSEGMNALASFATLLLLDVNFLSEESLVQLVSNVLVPFYSKLPTIDLVANKNLSFSRKIGKGIPEIVKSILDLNDFRMPPMTRYKDVTNNGRTRIAMIQNELGLLLKFALSTTYQTIRRDRSLFKSKGQDPFTPFTGRADIFDITVYGTAFGNDNARNDTANYAARSADIAEKLGAMGRLLAVLPENKGLDIAMRSVFENTAYLNVSQALVASTMAMAAQDTSLLASKGAIDTRRYDTIKLPLRGALSFIMYGISSTMFESNVSQVFYSDMITPKIPSNKAFYCYLERAILKYVYEKMMAIKADYIQYKHRPKALDLVEDILKLYFTKLEPSTRERCQYLLETGNLFPSSIGGAGFDNYVFVPPELISSAFDSETTGITADTIDDFKGHQIVGQPRLPYDDAIVDTNSVYKRTIEAEDKRVRTVYIHFDQFEPQQYVGYNDGRFLVYNTDAESLEGDFVSLKDLMDDLLYMPDTVSYEEIRTYGKQYAMDKPNIIGVRIDKVYTTFEFKEYTDIGELPKMSFTATLDRNNEYSDFSKFNVSPITIYYHRLTDHFMRNGSNEEVKYMRKLMPFISIPPSSVNNTFVHFKDANVQRPGLYKRESDGTLVMDDELGNVTIRGWNGVTYSSRLMLAVRDEQRVSIESNLMRPVR